MLFLLSFLEWVLRGAVFLTPWLALFIGARAFGNRYRFSLALVSTMVVYVALVGWTWVVDARLMAELNAFDLNHDGSFSPEESTPAAEAAMSAVSSDTGRLFAPFTGLVMAPLYVLFVFVVFPRFRSWLASHST